MSGEQPHPSSWREQLPGRKPEAYFHWRGKEVSRLEGFADAVFGFAVTLLVVALEVPHTVGGLVDVLRGFPAFTVCFALLMVFWNSHYRFFRRYGLEDRMTRFLSTGVLLLVIFSIYPLKFLFGTFLSLGSPNAPHIQTMDELKFVYTAYGLGFIGIWLLYLLLHVHALRLREQLQLTEAEVLQTREQIVSYVINIAVCALSIGLALLNFSAGMPGYVYMLLGPALWFNGSWHGRRARLAHEASRTASDQA
jgi:uncharacterized membrane protein